MQESVLGPLMFILSYIPAKCFELLKDRLYAYADDSTLLSVVHKPADRSAVAISHNRDLSRIQEWCNHWCTILNSTKTKDFVVSIHPGKSNAMIEVLEVWKWAVECM